MVLSIGNGEESKLSLGCKLFITKGLGNSARPPTSKPLVIKRLGGFGLGVTAEGRVPNVVPVEYTPRRIVLGRKPQLIHGVACSAHAFLHRGKLSRGDKYSVLKCGMIVYLTL